MANKTKRTNECIACKIPGWQGMPHKPTCKRGKAETLKRAVAILNDLTKHYINEDGDLNGETYEIDPYELHDLLVNLATVAASK